MCQLSASLRVTCVMIAMIHAVENRKRSQRGDTAGREGAAEASSSPLIINYHSPLHLHEVASLATSRSLTDSGSYRHSSSSPELGENTKDRKRRRPCWGGTTRTDSSCRSFA